MSDLPKRLRIKASMIALGERIAWGSDTALMEEAADVIEALSESVENHQLHMLGMARDRDQLRALLTAQSAPAGEREACSECNGLGFGPFGGCGECCGSGQASWQRTQAAGVPVGWQFYQDGKWWNGDDRIRDHRANTEAAGYPVRDVYAAAPAQPAAHPDDAAVDRFAVAMKAKLAKAREKGRHGWQTASAAHLSGLLYRHMYKADPLDVANLAMMLHQNGQAIELPQEARHDQGEVLTEHSGCGRGIQVDQLTVRMYPGDKVVMVRGRIGKALAASTGPEV